MSAGACTGTQKHAETSPRERAAEETRRRDSEKDNQKETDTGQTYRSADRATERSAETVCIGCQVGRRPEGKCLEALRSQAWGVTEAPCGEGGGSELSAELFLGLGRKVEETNNL